MSSASPSPSLTPCIPMTADDTAADDGGGDDASLPRPALSVSSRLAQTRAAFEHEQYRLGYLAGQLDLLHELVEAGQGDVTVASPAVG